LYATGAKRVAILDSWEEGIFNLSEELKDGGNGKRPELVFYLGNVRDKERIDEVFKACKPDVVLHAAAYKHVHLLEGNRSEARKTNYLGTKNLLDACVRHRVRDFVFISTDKAVRPKSVLGETKREAELLVKQYAKRHTSAHFMSVRFGNVLNSSGSVVPTFVKQIRERRPVTITHRDMTRYFMAIPEAVSLVLLSWVVGENGQILVLDMGTPSRILDLAIRLIRMHGLEPYTDIPIREIGVRPGEKIHEELAYDSSKLRRAPVPRVFIAEDMRS
jgi:FlaA1/EpsC-like NDP-sugar epimerase